MNDITMKSIYIKYSWNTKIPNLMSLIELRQEIIDNSKHKMAIYWIKLNISSFLKNILCYLPYIIIRLFIYKNILKTKKKKSKYHKLNVFF